MSCATSKAENVRALLDTHVLLWWLIDSERLSERARELMEASDTDLFWSAASSWEVAIKVGLGRLVLPEPARSLIPRALQDQTIRPIDITQAHALAVADLPPHHRDPFDRLLVAQATLDKLTVITADPVFEKYGARVAW